MITTIPLCTSRIHNRLVPHLQTMMKNLMRSRGCGVPLLCSATPERCCALSHSWVLRNTRTSLGSKGTSELHSSSLGDRRVGHEDMGREERGGSRKEAKGVVIRAVFVHNINMSKWYLHRWSNFILLWGIETSGGYWLCGLCKNKELRLLTSEARVTAHQWASQRTPRMPPTTAADSSHLSAGGRKEHGRYYNRLQASRHLHSVSKRFCMYISI